MITESIRHEFADWLRGSRRNAPLTVEAYLTDVGNFSDYLSTTRALRLLDVSEAHVAGFLEDQRRSGRKQSTIYRELVAIRRLFHWAIASGTIRGPSPTERISLPPPERPIPDVLSADEIDRLLATVDGRDPLTIRDRAMLEVACRCGISERELVELRWLNVRRVNAESYLQVTSPRGSQRIIPMTEECAHHLNHYRRNARPLLLDPDDLTDVVFLNFRGHPLSRMGYWKILQKWAEASGVRDRIKPSTLRHSFALRLLRRGANLYEVAALLGHASIGTTLVYLRFDITDLKEQVTRYHPRG